MSRAKRGPTVLPAHHLEPAHQHCQICGKAAWVASQTKRTLTRLDGIYRLTLTIRRCRNAQCPQRKVRRGRRLTSDLSPLIGQLHLDHASGRWQHPLGFFDAGRHALFHQVIVMRHVRWLCVTVATLMVTDSSNDQWIFRRTAQIHGSLSTLGRVSKDGIPYLAPEIQLLYKARGLRPRDEADFARTLPALDEKSRQWLAQSLAPVHPGHSWLAELTSVWSF